MVEIVLVAQLLAAAFGNEIDGFRLGMSMDSARQIASQKGYALGEATKTSSNWTSFALVKAGPTISFCGDSLSSVGRTYAGDLHELAKLVNEWTNALGVVEQATASQVPVGNELFSQLVFKWKGQDNVSRQIDFVQLGSGSPSISYSYSYTNHSCREQK